MASVVRNVAEALNIGALVIALFDVLRQIAGGAGMRRLLQNGQCIMAAAPRFQVSLALTDFLLPDFTLAGRAGGIVVHMRKRDGREAGQGEHRLIGWRDGEGAHFPGQEGHHLMHDLFLRLR